MVIVESGLSHRAFRDQLDSAKHVDLDGITVGLARGAAIVLFTYFFLRLQGFLDGGRWDLLPTAYGAWFLFEMFGFILAPALLFAAAARANRPTLVRVVAAWTVVGIIVSRLNVSVIAMNWSRPVAVHPELDGDRHLDHDHHHRRPDVPLDRQPHAGAARRPALRGARAGRAKG